jgi:2-aminoadipate transaminase
MSARALQARAEQRGATFLPGTHCFADGQGDDAIRLAFSFQPAEQIEEAIARIGAAMRAS